MMQVICETTQAEDVRVCEIDGKFFSLKFFKNSVFWEWFWFFFDSRFFFAAQNRGFAMHHQNHAALL
jgi:hypothetical protein